MRNEKGQFVKGHSEGKRFSVGHKPWNKGVSPTEKTKKKISLSKTGCKAHNYAKVAKICEICETHFLVSPALGKGGKGRFCSKQCLGQHNSTITGENHPRWIQDRSKLVTKEKKHLCSRYKDWMKKVKDRDKWTCRVADIKCNGRLEAHHILPWRVYPKLRYEVNNGITLCAAHHPRKRNDEERLAPLFRELVERSETI